MLSSKKHPGNTPVRPFLAPRIEATQAEYDQPAEEAPQEASAWRRLLLKGRLQALPERINSANRMWLLIGTLLLVLGGLAFFFYLSTAEVAGGCCGGSLLVLAGIILLVIGVRDQGEFSR